MPRVEEVFKTNGVPTYTFVRPNEYNKLLVNLRTPGRGLVVEGPSGIGKTSAVETAIKELSIPNVTKLSARRKQDIEYISELPSIYGAGVVIVDDFHKLPPETRAQLADYLKTLADEEKESDKLIIIGINKAGDNLVSFASDLVNRVDVLPFEANPSHKVKELIEQGERAMNVKINVADDVVLEAGGSFYLAQLLCQEILTSREILESRTTMTPIDVSLEAVKAMVWDRLGRAFRARCERFCRGTKFRAKGRAPYLHLLRWLAQSGSWSLSLTDVMRTHQGMRGSIQQVVEKGFLARLIDGDDEIRDVIHFDGNSSHLTIEDPQFLFYIRNIQWRNFAEEVGFTNVDFEHPYDFALSFAGADRAIAEQLATALREREVEVFYDRYEQHRILAEDVEEYLRPIYQSDAQFVVPLLSQHYPTRIWTKFESESFRGRLHDGAVIPIWFSDTTPGMFDETRRLGGISYSVDGDSDQIEKIADLLINKRDISR